MSEIKKDLYCPTCKEYPDEIKTVYDWTVEHREWVNDCYELQDVDYGDAHEECAKCGTTLEYKPQDEGNSDAETMSKV